MKISIKVGDVQVVYEEATEATQYPRIITPDTVGPGLGKKLKSKYLMEQIHELARLAARLHGEMYYPASYFGNPQCANKEPKDPAAERARAVLDAVMKEDL